MNTQNQKQNLGNRNPLALRDCHGLRLSAEAATPEELAAMAAAEDAVCRHARIHNGKAPEYQNGYGAPGWSKAACLRGRKASRAASPTPRGFRPVVVAVAFELPVYGRGRAAENAAAVAAVGSMIRSLKEGGARCVATSGIKLR